MSRTGCPAGSLGGVVIAYEPVWAIGENATAAAPDEIRAVHQGIHAWLDRRAPTAARPSG